jgi:hypothetical protein
MAFPVSFGPGDRNQHLIEQVLAELNAEDPPAPHVTARARH